MSTKTIHLAFDVELVPGQQLADERVTCLYEAGRIRYLKFKGREVIRLIYTAVRDQDWNTAEISISNEKIEPLDYGFLITYTIHYRYNEDVFQADIRISFGEVTVFEFSGRGLSTFLRNRIGICVLLPSTESMGGTIKIIQPDEKAFKTVFPELVSPYQPAKNIHKASWSVHEIYKAELSFSGDIFEMEDQRNWGDDSYKIYSTPVDLPLPVKIEPGEEIKQTMSLNFLPHLEKERSFELDTADYQPIAMPAIGYCRKKGHVLTDEEINLLKLIPFHHYRVELFINEQGWEDELAAAVQEAAKLDTKLELILMAGAAVENLSEIIGGYLAHIDSVLIVDAASGKPSLELFEFAKTALADFRPAIKIGYGTNNHFADLNRRPPVTGGYDFLSYGVTPQAHATDTRTIIENIAAPSAAIWKIRGSISDSAAIHISPVTLTARANGVTPSDKRFNTGFAAFWALGIIAGLEVAQITLFDAVGENGILCNGDASPLYKALKEIKAFNPVEVVEDFQAEKPAVVFFNSLGDALRFETDKKFFELG